MTVVTALRLSTGPLPDPGLRVLPLSGLAGPGLVEQRRWAFSRRANRFRLALGAIVAASVAGAPPALSQNYDVTTLPFAVNSNIGLNDNGVIVGEILNPDGSLSLGEWSQGALTNLGSPSGLPSAATYVDPMGINNSGTIVGVVGTSAGAALPFMYSDGSFKVLPLANPHDAAGMATAINNLGEIVGSDSTVNGTQSVWLWSHGAYTSLPVVSAGDGPTVLGINSSGTIVGNRFATCCSIGETGYVLTGSTVQYLSGGVNAINDAGVAVGSNGFATVIRNGTETPILNVPSTGIGINLGGDVVGFYIPPANGVPQAYIWEPNSGAFDVTPKGYYLALGQAINDQGDIIGSGVTPSGTSEDFLLTPDPNGELTPKALFGSPGPIGGPTGVPEPDTLLLFGLGLAIIVVGHRSTLARRQSVKCNAVPARA